MDSNKKKPEKGKSREVAPENDPEPASLSSRIASSASGLSRDLVRAPIGNEIKGQLASVSGLSSKLANGSSSSANESAWTESLPSHPGRQSLNGSAANPSAPSNGETFRSAPSHHAHDEEFNDFLLAGNMNDIQAHDSRQQSHPWTGDIQGRSDFTSRSPDRIASSYSAWAIGDSQHLDYDDGAEVRLLLSDPSFQASWEESEAIMAPPTEDTAMDLFSENYSPDEQRAADRIRNALPSPSVHGQVSSQNPLNLRPNFELVIGHMQSELNSEEVRNIEGVRTPRRQQLVADWDCVLNGYADEVWGDMLPAVKEARSQLQDVKAGWKQLDNRAVARLKMILGHVVQSADPSLLNLQLSFVANSSQDQGQRSGAVTINTQIASGLSKSAYPNGAQTNEDLTGKHAIVQAFNSISHNQEIMGQNQAILQQAHQYHARQDSPMEEEGNDDGVPEISFHCPWISCHERFNNTLYFPFHASNRTQYACPHQDCTAGLSSLEEWANHVEVPHHDLLDTGFRSMRHSPS